MTHIAESIRESRKPPPYKYALQWIKTIAWKGIPEPQFEYPR